MFGASRGRLLLACKRAPRATCTGSAAASSSSSSSSSNINSINTSSHWPASYSRLLFTSSRVRLGQAESSADGANGQLSSSETVPSEEFAPASALTSGRQEGTFNEKRNREHDHDQGAEADGPAPEGSSRRLGILEAQNSAEDLIYRNFQDSDGNIRLNEFKSALAITGLDHARDIRLKELRSGLKGIGRHDGLLSKDEFQAIVKPNIVLISRAMRGDFVIPDWTKFTNKLEELYWKCKVNKGGRVADYIPQLAKYNPDYFGVSMCTIDGQRFQFGDVDVPFTIQSSGKPINYAIALNELGSDMTHQYVGQEPSGRLFNDLSLKIFEDGERPKPHNPMVNSGAIVICSLLMNLIHKSMKTSEKFDWVCDIYKSMAHNEHVGFNNATFLSEREAADRNYAIGFYMRENKCFPEGTNLKAVMDFYFQLCSLEVNCLTVGMMAATLANGGICPMTEKRIFDSRAVRDVLSLMHSCGMYDYSGQFAFNVGLPAKSGVSGCTMVVIPNIGGLGLFSPPLDAYGNSVRSLQFCNELVNHFNFHQYDNLRHVPHKSDPRRKRYETLGLNIICLLFAAAKGDMSAIRRYYMSGMDMSLSDYDHRTALHSAAAEGHLHVIEFLLETCNLHHEPRDRWGRRPVDDANYGGHKHVADFLTRWPEIKQQLVKTSSGIQPSRV